MVCHVGAQLYPLSWDMDEHGQGYAQWDGLPPNCDKCSEPLVVDATRDEAPIVARWADDYFAECPSCGATFDCA